MAFTQREILEEIADATRPRRPRREPGCSTGLFSVRKINDEAAHHAVRSHRVANKAQETPNFDFWTTIEAEARRWRTGPPLRTVAYAASPSAPITPQWMADARTRAVPNADFWKKIEDNARSVSPWAPRAQP